MNYWNQFRPVWVFICFNTIFLVGIGSHLNARNVTNSNKEDADYIFKIYQELENSVLSTILEISKNISTKKKFNEASLPTSVDFMCAVSTQLSQKNCTDIGGGNYTANYDFIINWESAPSGENINIVVNGVEVSSIDPSTSISPDTVTFTLTADGVGQDSIITFFETTTSCSDTMILKSPTPCPPVIGGCTNTESLAIGPPIMAQEIADGSISIDTEFDIVETNLGVVQTMGLHYQNVNIPAGAMITSASIQFETFNTSNVNPINILIEGHAIDDAAPFSTSTPFDITSRTRTTNSVSWSPTDWLVANEIGSNQQTPNLVTIIQEIINRPGWNANQNLAFIFSGSGRRSAASQAVLNIEYESDGDCDVGTTCALVENDEIVGTVWEDYNFDGQLNETNPLGVQGVSVRLYDCIGNLVGTTYTNNFGNYEFTGLTTQKYSVVFNLPESIACWAQPTHAGVDNGTLVQFTNPGTCASLGLSNPANFCEVDPLIGLSCFSEGAYDNLSVINDPAIITLPHDADGHHFTGTMKTTDYQGVILDSIGEIGAVYGLAWQSTQQRMYLGAFHKRFSGFGPAGPDAIYQYDLTGNQTGIIELDAIIGNTNTAGADEHDFVTTNNGEIMDLGTGNASFDGAGKLSFGDLEMSPDMTTLYTVNLFDRKIYALDVADGIAANTSLINSWDTPDPTGTGIHRPFALKFHKGRLWVGIVTEDAANAYVYALDIASNTFNLELSFPLNYDRQQAIGGNADGMDAESDWQSWVSDADLTTYFIDGRDIAYPQPMLTDIEFDGEAMILGFRDRFGDQAGSQSYFNNADAGTSTFTWATTGGDILYACYTGYEYVIESGNSGSCIGVSGLPNSGPGGEEYYHWDYYHFDADWNPLTVSGGFHWEITQGALLQIPGQDYVHTTAMNPFSDYSGGIVRLNNTTGRREGITPSDKSLFSDLIGGYTIYETGDFISSPPPNTNRTFGKANGLGDLEAFCQPAPLEIGNYVWHDSLRNGLQDACEKGIDSMIVQLYDATGDLVGQDTTFKGEYYFNQYNVDTMGLNPDGSPASGNWTGMEYSKNYYLVFGNQQYSNHFFEIGQENYNGLTVANVNSNGDENIDSDIDSMDLSLALGQMPAGFPVLPITTASNGVGNHRYDIGLIRVYDYGDLPDLADGTTGVTDYETAEANGGPSHQIISGLFLGDTVDIDMDGFPDIDALGDDNDNVDDEDGIAIFPSLDLAPGGSLKLPFRVTNTTGDTAYLEAWIDWNGDGDFDELNEMVIDLKDNEDGIFPSYTTIDMPTDAIKDTKVGFRIRLSNENNMTPYGRVNSGEIEDYLLIIGCPETICVPIEIQIKTEINKE